MHQKRIVFYELNEVPFRVFDHFANLYPKSAIARIRRQSRAYETYAEDTGELNPWVSWPSLHRGVSNKDHEIAEFGMDLSDVDKEFPPIWKILANYGVKCGVFASLHSHPLPEDLSNYAFYVPDTFAAAPECFPEKYEVFQNFNLRMTGMNKRNVTSGVALKEAAQFLAAAPGLGLRGRTMGKLAQQLVSEKIDRNRTVRRRTSQAQIAFDVFYKALSSEKPDMSFFFTNHVASSMHRYWAAFFPDDFTVNPYSKEWQETWSKEIPYVIQETEHQIQRLMSFVERNPGYSLIVGTSMGQAAEEGRAQVRSTVVVSQLDKFMSGLSLQPDEWEHRPAMAPNYTFRISENAKDRFFQNLGGLTINGRNIEAKDLGHNIVTMVLLITNVEQLEVMYKGTKVAPDFVGLENQRLQDAAGRNALHVPNGMLIIYDPSDRTEKAQTPPPKISALEVAPALLANFGLQVPNYMSKDFHI